MGRDEKVHIENTEIRNQAHEMWAEGSSDEIATISEIDQLLNELGYTCSNYDAWFDTSQGFYRWYCDIKSNAS